LKNENITKEVNEITCNEHEIIGNIAVLKLKKRDGSFIDTQIDMVDLNKVLDKGIWYPEWNKDYNNYLVQNISYNIIDGKNLKEKTFLHSFILDKDSKTPIIHLDGNPLNNCRANLEVYNQNMKNEYEDVDDDTVSIILRDNNGVKRAKTYIDKDDLDRVINCGFSWSYFKFNKSPYAVSNTEKGRIYLHDFIMNNDENMIIEDKIHNTLDNRKKELSKCKFKTKQAE
jgi:hypothetical protein